MKNSNERKKGFSMRTKPLKNWCPECREYKAQNHRHDEYTSPLCAYSAPKSNDEVQQ